MRSPQGVIWELDTISTAIVGVQSDLQKVIDARGPDFKESDGPLVDELCTRMVNWEQMLAGIRLDLVTTLAELQDDSA